MASSTAFSCCKSSSLRDEVLLRLFVGVLGSGIATTGLGGGGGFGASFKGEVLCLIRRSFLGIVSRTGSEKRLFQDVVVSHFRLFLPGRGFFATGG